MSNKVSIIRHWPALYRINHISSDKIEYSSQELDDFVSFASCLGDLRKKDLGILKKRLKNYIKSNDFSGKRVIIWVSPFWRTLETAKELVLLLRESDIEIESITFRDELREVDNFEWRLFSKLVHWWIYKHNGKSIILDKSITNPNSLTATEYHFQWYHRLIDESYLTKVWLRDRVYSSWTYKEISERSKNAIADAFNFAWEDQIVILITHQGFSDWIIKENNETYNWQEPWEALLLTSKNGSYERIS